MIPESRDARAGAHELALAAHRTPSTCPRPGNSRPGTWWPTAWSVLHDGAPSMNPMSTLPTTRA